MENILIREKLYNFIKNRSRTHAVYLINIELWSKENNFIFLQVKKELKMLEEFGVIKYYSKYGWLAR